MTIAGIDLGTTFSSIGHINAEGIPALIPDAQAAGEFRTPSIVHVGEVGAVIGGNVARVLDDQHQASVAQHTKLQLESSHSVYQDHLDRDWSPTAINALILSKLGHDFTSATFEELEQVVIAVPSQFGDTQRRAVRRAAELAGIEVHSLVDESVAAATYLTKDDEREQTVLEYDLGGGTFDATVLRTSPESLSVLATEGDNRLGGKWIDELIVQQMAESLQRLSGQKVSASPEIQSQLHRLAVQAKVRLSTSKSSPARLRTIVGSEPFEFVLTGNHLDSLMAPMLDRSIAIAEKALQTADLGWDDLDQVYLVGGSSQFPIVREMLRQKLGSASTDITSRQPQDAVAYGAAILAANAISEDAPSFPTLRQSIAGYDLGVRIRNPRTGKLAIYNLVKRSATLPASGTKVFRTSRDDQTKMTIEVVQSKGDPATAMSLGNFSFGPIANPRASYPIEVTMRYDEEGMVSLRARDGESGAEMAHSLQLQTEGDSSFAGTDSLDTERELLESVEIAHMTLA